MKIITLNIHKGLKVCEISLKLIAFITVIAIAVSVSSFYFENNNLHADALAKITDENIIIIDAGHGGEDCGAIGKNGIYEKDLNFEIARTLGELLTEQGFAVIYTRTSDKLLYSEEENIKGLRKSYDLKNRCKIGAEYPNSMFLSIHMNSYTNEKYSGLQVYYSENNDSSIKLASAIQSTVKNELQSTNNRQIKPGREMYLLKNLENTSVLIECGFISNETECQKLSKKDYQKQLCFSIVCGIMKYKESVA